MKMNEKYDPVNIELLRCEAGWLDVQLQVGSQICNVNFSHCFDPIPDFIAWMEALTTDVMRCGFEIDEEGSGKDLDAVRGWYGRYFLTIKKSYADIPEVFISARVHRRQLIEAIYRGLQNFSRLEKYNPKEWAFESCGEFLAKLTGSNQEEILFFLLPLSKPELTCFFRTVLPSHLSCFSEEVSKFNSLPRILEFALQPDNEIVKESAKKYPEGWSFAKMNEDNRKEELIESLQEQANSWEGTPLHTLRSEILETYLASDRDKESME